MLSAGLMLQCQVALPTRRCPFPLAAGLLACVWCSQLLAVGVRETQCAAHFAAAVVRVALLRRAAGRRPRDDGDAGDLGFLGVCLRGAAGEIALEHVVDRRLGVLPALRSSSS